MDKLKIVKYKYYTNKKYKNKIIKYINNNIIIIKYYNYNL